MGVRAEGGLPLVRVGLERLDLLLQHALAIGNPVQQLRRCHDRAAAGHGVALRDLLARLDAQALVLWHMTFAPVEPAVHTVVLEQLMKL